MVCVLACLPFAIDPLKGPLWTFSGFFVYPYVKKQRFFLVQESGHILFAGLGTCIARPPGERTRSIEPQLVRMAAR